MTLDNTEVIRLYNENDNTAEWIVGQTRFFVDGNPVAIPIGYTTEHVIALMNDKLKPYQRVKVRLELIITTKHSHPDDAINEVRDSVEEYVYDYKHKACGTVKDLEIDELDAQVE